MKYRIIECKDCNGRICYKIQKKAFGLLWRNYKSPFVFDYMPSFGEIFDCAMMHKKYDYSKDEGFKHISFHEYEYNLIESAKKDIERFSTLYEYKGIRIYPALLDCFYVTHWGSEERFDIFGSYEDCCNGIDKKIRQIEEYEAEEKKWKDKERREKEYKKYKKVVSID